VQRCSLRTDRVVQPLTGFHVSVNQSNRRAAVGDVRLVLDGGYDRAGGRIAPLPRASTAGTLLEYAFAHPTDCVKDEAAFHSLM
jgi:hypothetical protein